MALNATTIWELRTTGSDNNGGGFDPAQSGAGTDYSQQDAAKYAGTNLAVDSATNTLVLPDGHTPAAADVGNFVQVTAGSGWTVGFYRITAITSGKWSLDRSPAATSTAGGTWAMGGALATWGKAFSGPQVGGGHTIWVKSGTYTIASTLAPVNVSPVLVRGYQATRGDAGARPLLTTSTNSTNLINSTGVNGWTLQHLAFSNTATTRAAAFDATSGGAQNWHLSDCSFDGFTYAIKGSFTADYTFNGIIERCEFKNQSGTGAYVYLGGPVLITGCYFHNNSGFAIYQDNLAGPLEIIGNIFYANQEDIQTTVHLAGTALTIAHNDFVSTVNSAVTVTDSAASAILYNNIFANVGGYAVNWSGGSAGLNMWMVRNNAFYNCTSGNYNGLPAGSNVGDIILTAAPFTNPSGGDFTLNTTAGGGALCRAAAYPPTIP